ncbi:MAG: glycosyltransferase family A protein [Planctomycetota bacterium]
MPKTHASASTTVDLVICTRDRCQDLSATLENLQRPEVTEGLDVVLTVVDNGSTDDTRRVVEDGPWSRLRPRYLYHGSGGLASARNAGIADTDCSRVVFIDDDVWPRPGWLAAMMEPLVEDRFDAVVGTVCPAAHLRRRWMGRAVASALALNEHERATDATPQLIGANMAFNRAVLERVPGFDPTLDPGGLGYGGDTLFSLQLADAGLRIGRAPDAVVDHHFHEDRLTRRSILASTSGFARSRRYINRRYGLWEDRDGMGRAAGVFLKLGVFYLTRPWVFWQREGCSNREFKLRNHWAYYLSRFRNPG